jgi:peptidoglycan/LPS O-acetylase OafA/YrhL
MADARRIVQLDGLRAVAVLMVFFSHAVHSQLLWTGVDLFFVLSGFLITGILLERRKQQLGSYLGAFYRRRIRRILPPYLLFLVLTSILFGTGWLRHWYLFLFLMNTAAFMELSGHYSVSVLWSLAVEEQFYLLWPFAVYLLDESVLAWLAAGLTLTAPLLRWGATVFFPGHGPVYFSTFFRMDLLAVGALIALAYRNGRATVERFGFYGLALAMAAATPLLLFSRFPWFQPAANTVLVNVWLYELSLIGYAGILLWALSGRRVEILKLRPLVYIGKISYSFYLVHLTILTIVPRYFHHYSAAVALAASLLYAALSWRFLELPILRGRKPGRTVAAWERPLARRDG